METIVKELIAMAAEDQALRLAESPVREAIKAADLRHAQRLREIIEEIGAWPGTSLVGENASKAAWLIAQHCDMDLKLQLLFLTVMMASSNDVAPTNIAYLIDRVNTNNGLPQVFGTRNQGAQQEPWEIIAKNTVNERRILVGLEQMKL